jgi:hypothetical protein
MAVVELVMASNQRITIVREVLLFEIERRCSFADCNERVFIGLTKAESLTYNGFDCSACDRWTPDELKKTDIPDWWDEIKSYSEPTH